MSSANCRTHLKHHVFATAGLTHIQYKARILASQVTYALVIQETWRYSYPLHTKNTVPAWAVPVLSTCGPASVFIAWYIIWRPSRWEMHNLILGLMASVFACALITNMIKITVGVILHAAHAHA